MSPEGPLPVTYEGGDLQTPTNLLVFVGDNPKAENPMLKDLPASIGNSGVLSVSWSQHPAGEAFGRARGRCRGTCGGPAPPPEEGWKRGLEVRTGGSPLNSLESRSLERKPVPPATYDAAGANDKDNALGLLWANS